MYQYVVSAQKPMAVTHVLKGKFLNDEEPNLILVKSTRIEFHTLTPGMVMLLFEYFALGF